MLIDRLIRILSPYSGVDFKIYLMMVQSVHGVGKKENYSIAPGLFTAALWYTLEGVTEAITETPFKPDLLFSGLTAI